MLTYKDAVWETCSSPGTGTITLLGAVTGYQSFSTAGLNGDTVSFRIEQQGGSLWEESEGVYTSSGTTLTRATVRDGSSGAGTLVNLTGTCNVRLTLNANTLNATVAKLQNISAIKLLGNPTGSGAAPSEIALGTGLFFLGSTLNSTVDSNPGQLWGFQLTYLTSTTINVASGVCRRSDDNTYIGSSNTIIDITTSGAGGLDTLTISGTGATNSSTATVTGTSTAFTTAFGTRALTGTISSSGATVTGTGTAFKSQVTYGDLIGTAAKGYFQVTAIASDTSLTIVSTPGSAFSADSANCIETPTIQVGSNTAVQVKTIASDTSLTIVANSSATVSGQAIVVGVAPVTTTMPASNNAFLYVWTSAGGTPLVSTQRTTPFFNSWAVRRVGTILLNAGSICNINQQGNSNERTYRYQFGNGLNNSNLLNGGTSTTPVTVVCSGVVPPTSTLLIASGLTGGTTAGSWYPRVWTGVAGAFTTPERFATIGGNFAGLMAEIPLDGAQRLEYNCSVSTVSAFLFGLGYVEYL